MRTILVIAGLAISVAADAQPTPLPTPLPNPGSPPTWGTRDPLALPGDNLPPTIAAVLVPPPINPNAPRTPVASPPLGLALKAAEAALAQCKADGYAVGVAVSNSVGGLVAGIQADNAFPFRVYNAVRKNLVAIEFGTPSSAVRSKLRAGDFATLARIKPNMTVLAGSIPLFADGKLIGAIAVSGAPGGERDEVCAAAGAALLGSSR